MNRPQKTYRSTYPMLGGHGRYQNTISRILHDVKTSAQMTYPSFLEYAKQYATRSEEVKIESVESSMETLFRLHFLQKADSVVTIGPEGNEYLQVQGERRNRFLIEHLIAKFNMYRDILKAFTGGVPLTAVDVNSNHLGSKRWKKERQAEAHIDWLRECGCLSSTYRGAHIITDFGCTIAREYPPLP